jgi:hypothetical protein
MQDRPYESRALPLCYLVIKINGSIRSTSCVTIFMTIGEQIKEMRTRGKSYRQIEKALGCSRSLISYHSNKDVKKKQQTRQRNNRFAIREGYKSKLGKKCCICGYSRCLEALEFHHIDESTKKFDISTAIWGSVKASPEEIEAEVKKCALVCANCHREIHSGLISL